jgi:hypothetical protein
MNATWITLLVVLGVLFTKIFTWYIDKPRRLAELRRKENAMLDELRWAAVHLDTRRMAVLERELMRLRRDIANLV